MVTFAQKRRLVKIRRVLRYWPWFVSVVIHIVVLTVLSTVVFISFTPKKSSRDIVPEARLGKIEQKLPLFQKLEPKFSITQESKLESKFIKAISAEESRKEKKLSIIAVENSSKPMKFSAQDIARITPAKPITQFFSSRGNAYNIVYVIDRSASMIDTMDIVKRELKRSIYALKPVQKFHIIFFSAGLPLEGPGRGLIWATTRNKKLYERFIDRITPEGRTDPRLAVKRAIDLRPDLIYLLTDGVFREDIAEYIIELAKKNHIKINTVAFIREIGADILIRIADETGGVYRYVAWEEIEQ